jgi:hypothetical protein
MPATYEPIATTTLGSAAATISFTSIASSWTDLRVVFVCTSTLTAQAASLTLNGDTAANYSLTRLRGNGTSASSQRETSVNRIDFSPSGTSSTIPQFYAIDLFSYAGSTNKTILIESSEDQNGSGNTSRFVALYRSTSAITSLTLTCNTSTFATGTTATLYGIKNA